MVSFALIGTVALVHILGAMSPGPDLLLAMRNSLMYSRRTGIFTALGIALGITVHITYSVMGLAWIISQSILLFTIIKFLGAGYLIYLGIRSFIGRTAHVPLAAAKKHDLKPFAAVKMGFLTNVLNPKVTLFFLGMFTLIISPSTPALTLLIISIIMVVNTFLWFAVVALFFTNSRIQKYVVGVQKYLHRVFGGMLIFVGVKLALIDS